MNYNSLHTSKPIHIKPQFARIYTGFQLEKGYILKSASWYTKHFITRKLPPFLHFLCKQTLDSILICISSFTVSYSDSSWYLFFLSGCPQTDGTHCLSMSTLRIQYQILEQNQRPIFFHLDCPP